MVIGARIATPYPIRSHPARGLAGYTHLLQSGVVPVRNAFPRPGIRATFFAVMHDRFTWLWDVDMDAATFEGLLSGQSKELLRDRHWALLRLIEYAPYREIRRLLPQNFFFEEWPGLASRVRSRTRREGMQFYYDWHRQRSLVNA